MANLGYSPPSSPVPNSDFPDPARNTTSNKSRSRSREREREGGRHQYHNGNSNPNSSPPAIEANASQNPGSSSSNNGGGGGPPSSNPYHRPPPHHYDSRTAEVDHRYQSSYDHHSSYHDPYYSHPPQPRRFFYPSGDGSHAGRGRHPSDPRAPPPGRIRTGSDQHPKYKTVMCTHWLQNNSCTRGSRCAFAHGEGDLRRPRQGGYPPSGPQGGGGGNSSNWRSQLCRTWQQGECRFGSNCRFAHGEHNLRVPPGRSSGGGGGGYPRGVGSDDLEVLRAENKYLQAQVESLKKKLSNCTCQMSVYDRSG